MTTAQMNDNSGKPSITFTDAELEKGWPDIPWRKSLPIQSLESPDVRGLGCRFCIARFGLRGEDIGKLPQDETEWAVHMAQFHPAGEAN